MVGERVARPPVWPIRSGLTEGHSLRPNGPHAPVFDDADPVHRRAMRVGLRLGPWPRGEVVTLAATDRESGPIETARRGEGRFPPTAGIIPRPGTGKARVWVDPLRLAEVRRTVAAVACDAENRRVESEVDGDRPLAIRAQRSDGVRADAVLMPLPDDSPDPPESGEPASDDDAGEQAQRIEKLEARVRNLTATVEALTRAKEVIEAKHRELVEERERLAGGNARPAEENGRLNRLLAATGTAPSPNRPWRPGRSPGASGWRAWAGGTDHEGALGPPAVGVADPLRREERREPDAADALRRAAPSRHPGPRPPGGGAVSLPRRKTGSRRRGDTTAGGNPGPLASEPRRESARRPVTRGPSPGMIGSAPAGTTASADP